MPEAPSSTEVRDLAALRDLHRVLLLVNSGESLHDVLQAAAEGVVEALGFRSVVVNLATPSGDFEATTVIGAPSGILLGARYGRSRFLAELACADDWGLLRFVPAGRVEADEAVARWSAEETPVDAPDAWRAGDELYAPLHAPDGELLAILSLDQPADGRRPDASARRLLEMYAAQIGVALSQAREKDRLRERVRLSRATHDIVQTAGGEVALDEVLRESVAPLRAGFRAERVWIRLFADEGGAWEAVYFPDDLLDVLTASVARVESVPPLDLDLLLRAAARVGQACWSQQRALVVASDGVDTSAGLLDARGRARVIDWSTALGHDQFVLVPLGSRGRCLGYVVLSRLRQSNDWTAAEEGAAMDLGRELGRVIATARARERERHLVTRLEQADEHRSQTFRTVVHELKNPLTAILGNLEVARDDPRDVDTVSRSLEAIASSSDRLLRLVGDMLTLAELRESSTPEAPQLLDLGELVREVVAHHETVARQADVSVDVSGVRPRVRTRGRREEIERMLVNLVSNAVKYSDPGDTVTVTLTRSPVRGEDGDELALTVADTGIGISAEDQQRIFVDFQRSSDPAAGARPGSGLGLAIAERVARRHGGAITVRSTLGVGSTFTVHLPLTGSDEVTGPTGVTG